MRVNDRMKEWSFSAQASGADKPEIVGVSLFISWNRCTSEHLCIHKWPDGEIPENKKTTITVCSLVPKYGRALARCERGKNEVRATEMLYVERTKGKGSFVFTPTP